MAKFEFIGDLGNLSREVEKKVLQALLWSFFWLVSATTPVFWFLDSSLLVKMEIATLIVNIICQLMVYFGRLNAAKNTLLTWTSCIIFTVSLSYPSEKTIVGMYFIAFCYPFMLFSLKKDRHIISMHLALVIVSAALSELYAFSDFRFGSLQVTGPIEKVIFSFLWLFELVQVSASIFLFNYLNMVAKDRIEEQKRNLKEVLDNINQGVFTVNKSLEIQSEYSLELEKIFNNNKLARSDFAKSILSSSNISSDTSGQLLSVLGFIGESSLNFEANRHFLPMTLDLNVGKQLKKVDINWSPIVKDDQLEKVLFTVQDVTEILALKESVDQQSKDLQLLQDLLKAGLKASLRFLRTSLTYIDQSIAKNDSQNLRSLFINLHTIKGNARFLGFKEVIDKAHALESYYSQVTAGQPFDQAYSKQELINIKNCLLNYSESMNKYLGDVIKQLENDQPELQYLKDVIYQIITNIPSICQQEKIHPLQFEILELSPMIESKYESLLCDIFAHLVRNSISHGIEEESERALKKKPLAGKIVVSVGTDDSSNLVLRYEDDGRGLDLNKIRAKTGLDQTPLQVAMHIFDAGLSTKDNINSISGRGVGMDAVKSMIEAAGGTIDIIFRENPELFGFQPFLFRIVLPTKKPQITNAR